MTNVEKKSKGYSWFRRPRREDFQPNIPIHFRHLAMLGTSVNPKNPGPGVARAVDSNTHKLEDLIFEYRYQSACSDWKANVAIVIAIVSVLCSIVIGTVFGVIAHYDSEGTTAEIVSAIQSLKGSCK